MSKLFSILIASSLMFVTNVAWAAPADNPPPVQQQKDKVPNTNQNGNYLEPQQDNNNNASDSQQGSSNNKRPGNAEKSKRFHEKPQEGGTNVKQQ